MVLLNDFKTSVRKAFKEIHPLWESFNGLVVCGSHSPTNIDETLEKIKEAREKGTPFLGICMGLQLAVIEYARNVLGIKDANTEEIDPLRTQIIKKLPRLRIGVMPVYWGDGVISFEDHWHNYAVNPLYLEHLEGLEPLVSDGIVEAIRISSHPYFFAVQFHPEYRSSKEDPHKVLFSFLSAAQMAKVK